jgi:hypothetical protein
MLGHRFGALERLFAFLATVLVGGMARTSAKRCGNLHSTDRARAASEHTSGQFCSGAGDRLHSKQIV